MGSGGQVGSYSCALMGRKEAVPRLWWSGSQLFLCSGDQVATIPRLWWSGRQLFLGSGGQVGSSSWAQVIR
jgi:hypothetical protein